MSTDNLPESESLDERTALAWTRTGLAVLVASLIVARLTLERLGPVSVVMAALGPVVTVAIVVSSRRRFQAAHEALRRGHPRPDARLPALVAGFTVAVALIELSAILR